MDGPHRIRTQKEFLRVAAHQPVSYLHPGTFQAGSVQLTVKPERIAPFAAKLSSVLSFSEYDRLTRSIWLSHFSPDGTQSAVWGGSGPAPKP